MNIPGQWIIMYIIVFARLQILPSSQDQKKYTLIFEFVEVFFEVLFKVYFDKIEISCFIDPVQGLQN